MTQQLTPFNFEGFNVRVVSVDGDPWFVAKDVADVLGYANAAAAISAHCKAANTIAIHDGKRGNPNQTIIPERDLYRLVLKSQLPAAERFEEWVVGEVLPSIRKTGAYVAPAASVNPSKVAGEIAIAECYARLLKPAPSSQVAMLAKIAESNGLSSAFLPAYAVDAAANSVDGSSMPTKSVTALLREHAVGISPSAFNERLASAGYLKQLSRTNSKGHSIPFWSITAIGLDYGKNLTSPHSPRETQPHWYTERFSELTGLVLGRRVA